MTTRTWLGGINGDWSDPSLWSPYGVPGAGDAAFVGSNALANVFDTTAVGAVVLAGVRAGIDIYSGVFSAPGGLTLGTGGLLTVGGALGNTVLTVQGGWIAGHGTLEDDTVVGTLGLTAPGAVMYIGGAITLAGAAGQVGVALSGLGAGLYTAASAATIDGGIVQLASPSADAPAVLGELTDGALTLGPDLTVDVTGNGRITNSSEGIAANPAPLVAAGTINVAGGTLAIEGAFTSTGAIHITSGTLDLSGALAVSLAQPIEMDGAGAHVVLANQAVAIAGFRAGDSVDFTRVTAVANMYAKVSGGALQLVRPDGVVVGSVGYAGTAPNGVFQLTADRPGGAGQPTGVTVTTTVAPPAAVGFVDQTTGMTGSHPLDSASVNGPGYLQWQYQDSGADTVAMTATLPNVFLKGGSGTKALAVTAGQNVVDGGSGSSFLAGGSGTDTFFVDVRGSSTVWDTLTNFHAGDAVTVWGWSPGSGTETVDALAGAGAFQGATLRLAGAAGGPVSSVTFAGMSASQVGALATSSGVVGGLPYLYFFNPGV